MVHSLDLGSVHQISISNPLQPDDPDAEHERLPEHLAPAPARDPIPKHHFIRFSSMRIVGIQLVPSREYSPVSIQVSG